MNRKRKSKIDLSILKKPFVMIPLIVLLVLTILVSGFKVYNNYKEKKAAEIAANDFTLHDYTLEELQGGTYYVKDGEKYHTLPTGFLLSTAENDTLIPLEANPTTRMTMFWKDEERIPTLYKDGQLIYKAAESGESTPTQFVFERFKDEGFSVGIRGLSNEPDKGKYKTVITETSLYPRSSISTLNCKVDDTVIVDKVNGIAVTEENVSTAGTITGLTFGETYSVDAYCGTNYIGMQAVADTHMLTSYELYTLTDYSMDTNNYMVITMPDYMHSGYYYINGVGCFKYINRFKSEGSSNVDYNIPYFLGVDDSGAVITNPATNTTTEKEEEKADENKEFTWNYNLSIDNQQKSMKLNVLYSPLMTMIDGKIITEDDGASITAIDEPSAVLTSPTGETFTLELLEDDKKENEDEDVLTTFIENPVPGTWNLAIKGMYARIFDIETEYSGSTSNMVVKDGEEETVMIVYIPKRLENAKFTFNWEDTNHAAIFEFENENDSQFKLGSESTPEKISEQTYGKTVFDAGLVEAGEYKINISGESLGHVYFNYEDAQTEENAEDDENSEDTKDTEKDEKADEEKDTNKKEDTKK